MHSKNRAYLIIVASGIVAFLIGRSLGTGPELVEIAEPIAAPTPTPVAQPTPAPTPAPTSAPKPAPQPPPQQPVKPPAKQAQANPAEQVWKVELNPEDASKGPANAPVTVVLFTSFGCPECAAFQPALDQVFTENPGKVRVVIKHKVLPTRHPDAILAAQASLAAKAQGKFWPYYEKLLAAGNRIQRSELDRLAAEVGLNTSKFKADLDSEKFRGQVLRDSLLAYAVGAHSYPNILANGVRINKAKDYASLKSLVASQLAIAEKLTTGGLNPENVYKTRISGAKSFPQLQARIHQFNNAGSPGLGPENAKIQVTVFEDFECPFCARISPSLKALHKKFPNDVRIVFKHMPLVDIHPNAQRASEASMFALQHGKFWELHDLFFRDQKKMSEADVLQHAQSLGLDTKALKEALDKGTFKSIVQRDVNDARRTGATGTPSVFMNGRRYTGPQGFPPEGLEAVARAHLGL